MTASDRWQPPEAPRSLKSPRRGSVAIEYAIVLPAFLLLTFGAAEMGRLMWTQVTLDRAVEAAARCGVVDGATCGAPELVQAYAARQAYGLKVSAEDFSVAAAACGEQVAIDRPFHFYIPFGLSDVTIQAKACYPIPPAS